MKAILEFNLPTDEVAHRAAVHAIDWALVVCALDEWLRHQIKHGVPFPTSDDALQAAREQLMEEMEDRGINLDMIP